ncbi:hypothetical protein ACUOA5_21585, partial [Escherichia coli]
MTQIDIYREPAFPALLLCPQDSPLWIIGVLTLTGIAVGLVIRFS